MAAKLFYLPFPVALTTRGVGAPSAKAYFYETGTTTPLATYTTDALSIEHPHPIVANASGRFPEIYLDNAVTARCIITDRDGAELCDVDPYIPGTAPDAGSLQPYADAAEASATNSSASASSASTSASSASTSASSATASASAAAASATIADNAADAAALAVSLPSAAIPAANRTALALLSTSAPGHLMEARREGMFVFDSSDLSALVTADTEEGVYVAPSSDATGASGAWVRRFSGPLNVRWFGAIADNATDASTAINAAIALSKALGQTGTYSIGGPSVYIPSGIYYCASTIDWNHTLHFYGDGGGDAGGEPTVLRFPAGQTGLRLQYVDTSGASDYLASPTHSQAANSIIEKMVIKGGYADWTSTPEGEYHGLHAKVRFSARDVLIYNFQGDGFHIKATANTTDGLYRGNANCFRLHDCAAFSCRNGLYIQGEDTNAGSSIGFSSNYNRRWGIWDRSFLGNTHLGAHVDGNGITDANATPCVVSHGGNRYAVAQGQETAASTNAPTGTTLDNTYWIYSGVGGVAAPQFPAWVSGITIRSGGSLGADSVNSTTQFIGCYCEGGQGAAQIQQNMMGIGGFATFHSGPAISGRQGALYSQSDVEFARDVRLTGNSIQYGDFTGYSTDITHESHYNNAANHWYYSSGAAFNAGDMYNGFYRGVAARVEVRFYIGTSAGALTQIATLDTNGFNMASGKAYYVNSQQVVGARDTGWAADTGTAKKTANATYTVGSALTVGAAYVQAEHTAIITRQALVEAALRDATQTIKAMKDALTTHGLIGA